MENGDPLTARGLSYLNYDTYLYDVSDIGGKFYEDGREEELEPGYVMG